MYLCGLFLSGAGISVLLFGKNRFAVLGVGIPIGAAIYIAVRHFPICGTASPWPAMGISLVYSSICMIIRMFLFESRSTARPAPVVLSKTDCLLLAANAIVWLWKLSSFVGYDQINHFFFAAQIQKGIFPPSGYAFSHLPVKYHYGWDILLSDIGSLGHVSWEAAEDILSAVFVISNSITLLYILKKLFNKFYSYLVFGCFMFGTGVLGYIRPGCYLQLFSMYHQHAWAFTRSILLLYILVLTVTDFSHWITRGIAVLSIGLAAPVYSAHSVLLHGIFLAFCGTCAMVFHGRRGLKMFAYFAITGIILLGLWWYFNVGILVRGDGYCAPNYRVSPSLLGIGKYILYMLGYVLMTPVTMAVWCGTAVVVFGAVFKKNIFKTLFRYPPGIIFCALCVLLLYPTPFMIMMANSAYWDNFCKFNYIGVLASWFLCPYLLQWIIKTTGKRIFTLCCFASLVFLYPVWDFGKSATASVKNIFDAASSSAVHAAGLPKLLETVREMPQGEIILINPELHSHYTVNETTNKAEVNLYWYIDRYFGKYTFLATEQGFPVINFYDYNFLYSEDSERKQLTALDRLYKGDETALHDLSASYLIAPMHCPVFIRRAVQKKILSPLAANHKEDWALFKVNRISDN